MGSLLDHIRAGLTVAPREFIDDLLNHGFLFSLKNLALHFAKLHRYHRLDRQWSTKDTKASLLKGMPVAVDLEEAWVKEFRDTHNKLRAIIRDKRQKVPFGKALLTDAQIRKRYATDLKKGVAAAQA